MMWLVSESGFSIALELIGIRRFLRIRMPASLALLSIGEAWQKCSTFDKIHNIDIRANTKQLRFPFKTPRTGVRMLGEQIENGYSPLCVDPR